jgi:hypothetical protein
MDVVMLGKGMTFGAVVIVVEAAIDNCSFDELLSFQIFIGFLTGNIVVNIGVAAETFNFMGGNMVEVHLLAAVTAFEEVRFRVALDTDVVHDVAVTVDDAEVTLLTVDAAVDIALVNKWHIRIGINVDFGSVGGMTGLTVGDFQMILFVVEVTHETGGFGDGQVFTLNNLGVAADTFELLAPAQAV